LSSKLWIPVLKILEISDSSESERWDLLREDGVVGREDLELGTGTWKGSVRR